MPKKELQLEDILKRDDSKIKKSHTSLRYFFDSEKRDLVLGFTIDSIWLLYQELLGFDKNHEFKATERHNRLDTFHRANEPQPLIIRNRRYQHYYKGLEVYPSYNWNIREENGFVTIFSGVLLTFNENLNTVALISKDEAKQIARDTLFREYTMKYLTKKDRIKLVFFQDIHTDKSESINLTYRVNLYSPDPWSVFVDAKTGEVRGIRLYSTGNCFEHGFFKFPFNLIR